MMPIRRTVLGNVEPLVVKPREACRMLACGNTRLYELLTSRELDSFLDGRSRKITVESIRQYIARRMKPVINPPRCRKRPQCHDAQETIRHEP
jgi:excisionase family DNA binding protein